MRYTVRFLKRGVSLDKNNCMKTYIANNLDYLRDLIITAITGFNYKIVVAIVFSVFSFFFDPTKTVALAALLALIIFDTITGVSASYKLGIPIESRKMLRSAIKVCFYFLFVSAGHLCQYILGSILPIETTVIAFLALTELVSIIENLGKLGYSVPQHLLLKLKNLKNEQ